MDLRCNLPHRRQGRRHRHAQMDTSNTPLFGLRFAGNDGVAGALLRSVPPLIAAIGRPRSPGFGLRRHCSALTAGEARQIVSEIGAPGLRSGARQSNGSHDKPHPHLGRGEHVFDPAAHPRPRRIPTGYVRRHRPAARLGTLELRHQRALLQQRQLRLAAMGGIRSHVAGGVGGIERGGELAAVVPRRVGDGEAADEACARSMPMLFL